MAKGKNRIQIIGMQGMALSDKWADWSFIYSTSTTKDPLHNPGDVVVVPGRGVFVYSKSSAACISGQGCEFTYAGYVAYTAFTTTAAVGAMLVTIPAATHATLTADELRNGFIWIFDGSTNNVQFRQIVGNDAASANAAFVVYLDGPLTEAVTTSSCCEVAQNPFVALRTGTMNYYPKAGVPAVKVTAASTYFWCQVGRIPSFCWVAPQGGKLGTTEGGYAGGFWSDVGNVSDANTSLGVTVANGRGSQYAGNPVVGDADNIGPLFMLA
jgi:hypothetical protein